MVHACLLDRIARHEIGFNSVSRNASPLRPAYSPPSAGLRQRLLLAIVALLFAVGAGYGALVLATHVDNFILPGNELSFGWLRNAPGIDNTPAERMNFLVMGLDRRPAEGEIASRTDTMFVLTVDPKTKTAGILGIPRDWWVEIPDGDGGYYEERINASYVLGDFYDYKGGGKQLVIDTVEHNLGINIDHYIFIDFEGFKEIIDALGGIDVDVPDYLYDPYYSDTELPGDYFPLDFEPGLQHMDGRLALGYARSRNTSNDFDRIQRQQRVTFAVMDKALSINALDNALDLWNKYKHTVDTDINDAQMPGLAILAAKIPPERIIALSLGPAMSPWTTSEGAAVLLSSEAAIQRIVQSLFTDQKLLEEKATVEIQNGTYVDGLAASTLQFLANLGFPKASLLTSVPPDGSIYDETVIIDYSGKQYTAQKIAAWLELPPESVRVATAADSGYRTTDANIVILLGADAKIPSLDFLDEDTTE